MLEISQRCWTNIKEIRLLVNGKFFSILVWDDMEIERPC